LGGAARAVAAAATAAAEEEVEADACVRVFEWLCVAAAACDGVMAGEWRW
jgi:hypothetical protein